MGRLRAGIAVGTVCCRMQQDLKLPAKAPRSLRLGRARTVPLDLDTAAARVELLVSRYSKPLIQVVLEPDGIHMVKYFGVLSS